MRAAGSVLSASAAMASAYQPVVVVRAGRDRQGLLGGGQRRNWGVGQVEGGADRGPVIAGHGRRGQPVALAG